MSPYTLGTKAISIVILIAFITTSVKSPAYAQTAQNQMPRLPAPGTMIHLSPEFVPAHLKGIVIHPENALKFDFIIYKGEQKLTEQQKREEYTKLIKYFLASLAVPDDNQWVNLSPYEKNRIIKEDFGKTEMGRDLLAQDYLLKQITASLIYPQDKLGQKFWDKVYAKAYQQFGTTNVPLNTFNKVWIVPDNAVVYEKGNMAYVVKNHLKVMLEEDYLSLQKHSGIEGKLPLQDTNKAHSLGSQVVREIVLPELEKEVNEGKNFAPLRQVFSGMVLAAWYKRVLKESLLGKIYANKSKLKGVDQDPKNNEVIYQQYLKAFKKGVFNFIKEDVDKYTNETIPRKYFSGGATGQSYNKGMPGVNEGQPALVREQALKTEEIPVVAEQISDSEIVTALNREIGEMPFSTNSSAKNGRRDGAMTSLPEEVASDLHEQWKADFVNKNGADAQRWKAAKDSGWEAAKTQELELTPGKTVGAVRMTAEGKVEIDIAHMKYDELTSAWQGENKAAGVDGVSAVQLAQAEGINKQTLLSALQEAKDHLARGEVLRDEFGQNNVARGVILKAGDLIHKSWLTRNGSWAPAEQKLAFNELDANNQKLDLNILEVALNKSGDFAMNVSAEKVASQLHEQWKADFSKKNGAEAQRWKAAKDATWEAAKIQELGLEAGKTVGAVRMTAEGKVEIDIAHMNYDQLTAAWQGENKAAGVDGVNVLEMAATQGVSVPQLEEALNAALEQLNAGTRLDANFTNTPARTFIMTAGDEIHKSWLTRNGSWAPSEQKSPFSQLDTNNQKLDLNILQVAIEVSKADGAQLSDKVASRLHEQWKADYAKKNGAESARWKAAKDATWEAAKIQELGLEAGKTVGAVRMTAEGKVEIDIAHMKYEELTSAWQVENKAAGMDGVNVLEMAQRQGISSEQLQNALKTALNQLNSGAKLDDNFGTQSKEHGLILTAGDEIHKSWLTRNGSWAPAEQKLPFSELDANNQKLDLNILQVTLDAAMNVVPQQLQGLTEKIKKGEQGLEGQRAELATRYLKEQLGERIVDGKTVGNNEIVAIVESYITDEERTDVQTLLLEGEYTDKVIAVLKHISEIASQTLTESLVNGVQQGRRIQATQADLEKYIPSLKQKSTFYVADEIAQFKNQAEYWKGEADWVKNRKTTDPRWSKLHSDGKTVKSAEEERSDTRSLLQYAQEKLEPELGNILQAFVQEAGLQGQFANVSYRTKGAESAIKKLNRLRGQPWAQGKDVSIADLVDLLGGRIVVDDLKSLERVVLAVERIIREKQDDPRFKGMRILRKENKFIANDGKSDPYRAVQFTITMPGQDSEQFTFELQLKTFSSMVASDLFHNAVYKPEILNLPGDLQQTVQDYNWQSDVEEAEAYLGREAVGNVPAQEIPFEQRVANAIEERDFNAFYDLVLSKIEAGRQSQTFTNKSEWIKAHDQVNQLLNKEIEFLNQLRESRPDIIEALARASHDNGYYRTKDVAGEDGRSGVINDPNSIWLKPELSNEALGLLSTTGKTAYDNRYENFRGNNNKLSVGQLDLHNLSPENLRAFFKAVGKDIAAPQVARLIQDIETLRGASAEQLATKETKKILNKPILNLYHQSFDELSDRGKAIVNVAAANKWAEAIINNQLKAVAVSVLLTEIGGVDERGRARDLGKPASEKVSFALREKLIHEFWVFALQYNGEFAFDGLDRNGNKDPEGWRTADPEGRATMSYEEFVTSNDGEGHLKFANQINLDRTIDEAIFKELAKIHLKAITQSIVENKDNPIKLASLQRARAEIMAKFVKSLVPNHQVAGIATGYIDQKFGLDSEILLRGNGGSQQARETIVSLASRNQAEREAMQEKLAQAWHTKGMTKSQRTTVELLNSILGLADFTDRDTIELSAIIQQALGATLQDTTQVDIQTVLAEATKHLQPIHIQKIERAIKLAQEIHAGQPRATNDSRPYSVHIAGVTKGVVLDFKIFDLFQDPNKVSDLIAASFLHDSIEDVNKGDFRQSLSRELPEDEVKKVVADRIRHEVGEGVLSIVQELSKPVLTKFSGVPEQAETDYINSLQTASVESQVIKLADWNYNFGDLVNMPASNRQATAAFVKNRLDAILNFVRVSQTPKSLRVNLLNQILKQGRINNALNETIPGAESVVTLTKEQEEKINSSITRISSDAAMKTQADLTEQVKGYLGSGVELMRFEKAPVFFWKIPENVLAVNDLPQEIQTWIRNAKDYKNDEKSTQLLQQVKSGGGSVVIQWGVGVVEAYFPKISAQSNYQPITLDVIRTEKPELTDGLKSSTLLDQLVPMAIPKGKDVRIAIRASELGIAGQDIEAPASRGPGQIQKATSKGNDYIIVSMKEEKIDEVYMVNENPGDGRLPINYIPINKYTKDRVTKTSSDAAMAIEDILRDFRSNDYFGILDFPMFQFESIHPVDTKNLEKAITAIYALSSKEGSLTANGIKDTLIRALDVFARQQRQLKLASVVGFEVITGVAKEKLKEKDQLQAFTDDLGLPSAFSNWMRFKIADGRPAVETAIDLARSDAAMKVNSLTKQVDRTGNPLGGIDFNAANLNLQIKRDGKGVPLPIAQQNLENITIDGLIPVIIDIKPAMGSPLMAELQVTVVQQQARI